MKLTILKVLLYMHYLVRKRRYVRSLFELVWPITIFVYFGYTFPLRNLENLSPGRRMSTENAVTEKKLFFELGKDVSGGTVYSSYMANQPILKKIVYYPVNAEILALVNLFEYNMREINDVYHGRSIQFKGFFNESRANEEINFDKTERSALIEFENFGIIGKSLKYSVRVQGAKDRNTSTKEDFMFDPSMAIQWALNKAFLRLQGVQADLDMRKLHFPMLPRMRDFRDEDFVKLFIQKYKKIVNANLMLVMTFLSMILYFINLVACLSVERATGHKELLRMNGVSHYTLRLSHIINALPISVIIIAGTTTVACGWPVNLPCTPWPSVLLTNFLFVACTTAFAFVLSTFLKNTALTIVAALFLYMGSMLYTSTVPIYNRESKMGWYLYGLPYYWYLLENSDLSENFYSNGTCRPANILVRQSVNGRSVLACWLYLLLQTVVLSFLAWYLDCVRPGTYGVAKPPFFLIDYRYWKRRMAKPNLDIMDTETDEPPSPHYNEKYFQTAGDTKEVGIKVIKLNKVYGNVLEDQIYALDNVTLDLYKGEITVLLGHNGAGKTTLMSIITGMFSPSSGKVYVDGYDTSKDMDKIIKNLGLCPQKNISIADLTVAEHIIFFAMLKGLSHQQAVDRSRELLINMDLLDRRNNLSNALSGGMRRRLQLACALAAPAQTIILDEPTSGLDVRTRRELWNILLNIRRGESTVLVSTHYMEEAEALGDRVLVLKQGNVIAYAPPNFLKIATGGGYRIRMVMKPDFDEEEITFMINSIAPMAELEEEKAKSLVYFLPPYNSHALARLFDMLEAHKSEFGIKHIGIGLTTMEEMFLKLTSDNKNISGKITKTDRDLVLSLNNREELATGFSLFKQRFQALIARHLKQMWVTKTNFIIIVLLVIVATFYVTRAVGGPNYKVAGRRELLRLSNLSRRKRFMYDVQNIQPMQKLVTKYAFVDFVPTKHPLRDQTHWGREMRSGEYIGALDQNGSSLYVVYSEVWREAGPLTLAVLSSVLASQVGAEIESQVPSLIRNQRAKPKVKNKPELMLAIYSCFLTFASTLPLLQFGLMKIIERRSGVRHNHLMTGVNPATHWCASVCAGVLVFTGLICTAVVIAIWTYDDDDVFDRFDFVVSIFCFLTMYACDYLSFVFLMSLMFGTSGLLGWGIILSFFTGVVEMGFFLLFYDNDWSDLSLTLKFFLGISMSLPMATFCSGVYNMAKNANQNAHCIQLYPGICKTSKHEFCCGTPSKMQYLHRSFESFRVEMALIHLQFVAFMGIILLVENGVIMRWFDHLLNRGYEKQHSKNYFDRYVEDEEEYVEKQIVDGTLEADERKPGGDLILVYDIHKVFPSKVPWRRGFNAVKGVSFSIKSGECFGLLGVNGAGKSTVFNMLTGVTPVTKGIVHGMGFDIRTHKSKFLAGIGYCPQFEGVDDFLTGYDNLYCALRLMGHSAESSDELSNLWLKTFGLEDMGDRVCTKFSGGQRRRLAAAVAMVDRYCALLDEPTSGVDPSARRMVWRAVRLAQAASCAVIMISHSMEEMEAITDRIGVMSSGEMRALGSASELEARHAVARIATFTLKPKEEGLYKRAFESRIESLTLTIEDMLTASLIDQHTTMLKFSLGSNEPLSYLFRAMERIKQRFRDVVQDYIVRDTSFEEVFLAFAKEDQAMKEMRFE